VKPGGWYEGYARAAIAAGRKPGHFVLKRGRFLGRRRDVWVTFDPDWDRSFGLLSGEYIRG
jgi:hypothetical protein